MGVDATGLDATDRGAFERWRVRRESQGVRVDMLDLYDEIALARGTSADELPLEDRKVLSALAMEVIWPGFEKVGAARPARPIELVAPRPEWAAQFADWRERLFTVLSGTVRRVSHIGSTSIPGLDAKPILDVLATVPDLEDESSYVPQIDGVGLELYSRDVEHRFFVNATPPIISVHLHVCPADGAFERDHLLFRDYLRAHDDERDTYAAVKRRAALRWKEDRQAYTYAKSDVILDLLDRAEVWAKSTLWRVEDSP